MMTWKVEAEGDTVYVEATDIDKAEKMFENAFGKIPKHLVKWTMYEPRESHQDSPIRPRRIDRAVAGDSTVSR